MTRIRKEQISSGAATDGQVLTADGSGNAAWETPAGGTLADHDHSGDAGDGGAFDAANLGSGAATDGQVLTADGLGGAAWEAPAAGASALDDLTDVDAPSPSDNDVLTWDEATSSWVAAAPPAGGIVDAADVTYTPTTVADWDGSADPGDAVDALDQLAARVTDLESAGPGGGGSSILEVQVFS